MNAVLDRCVWHALSGRQAQFARGDAMARRYGAEYAPFGAMREHTAAGFSALLALVPAGGSVALFTPDEVSPPAAFAPIRRARVAQMVLAPEALGNLPAAPPAWRDLHEADVPAMLDLVALTRPGPFAARTFALGRYVGVFRGDVLVAMAGERMRLDGFVEISAVCTHPGHRGHGLAAGLIAELSRAALARSETPFLHAFADNMTALALYRRLGFVMRATLHLAVVGHAEAAPEH